MPARIWMILIGLVGLYSLALYGHPPQVGRILSPTHHTHTTLPLHRLQEHAIKQQAEAFAYLPTPQGKPTGLLSPFPEGQWGGTLQFAELGTGPKTFNTWASFDASSSGMGERLSCGLLTSNVASGALAPWVAESWRVHPNQTTVDVVIRQGLRWSDGHPLGIDDVVFTWNVIYKQGLGNPSTRDMLTLEGRFPSVRALNSTTVRFELPRPFAPFLRVLGSYIAPKHIFAPIVAKGGDKAFSAYWNSQQAAEHPEQFVSCGPWILKSYSPSQRIQFVRNPHYYVFSPKTHRRLPYANGLNLTIAKDKTATDLLFHQGALDAVGIQGSSLSLFRRLPPSQVSLWDLGPVESSTFVVFNLATAKAKESQQWLVPPKVQAWLNNKALRQAMNLSMNRPQLVETVLQGIGSPKFGELNASSPFANVGVVAGFQQNVVKARSLLKQAGFTWNPQGHLLDVHGERVTLELMTNAENANRERAALQLKDQWEKTLGLQVFFKSVEFNTLLGRQASGQWQLLLMGLTGSGLEPHGGFSVWHSQGILHLFKQRRKNWTPQPRLPWETAIDTALAEGTQSMVFEQRLPHYQRLQQVIADEAPMLYLYAEQHLWAVHQRLQNVQPTPIGGVLHNLESIWLKPSN